MRSESSRLLVTRDPTLAEVVLASAAALASHVVVARDAENLRRMWRNTELVLVGLDAAELVMSLGLSARNGVYLVGTEPEELARYSVPLGAAVVTLPDNSGVLASLLREPVASSGAVGVWLIGAGGGLGCTTLAATLSAVAARKSRVAAVELDPYGGLDLVFGAETTPGWRWPELAGAVGQLDALTGQVPHMAGVDLIAMGRSGYAPPGLEAVQAVAGSLARSHELVVFDGGRARPTFNGLRVWLLVGGDVRSVAAAQVLGDELDLSDAEVVIRAGAGRSIAPELVADTLGLPLVGSIPAERRLPRMVEAGRVPGSVRGRYRNAVIRLREQLR